MELYGSKEKTISKDKDSKNVPRLRNIEVALVDCNIVNIDYQNDSRVSLTWKNHINHLAN